MGLIFDGEQVQTLAGFLLRAKDSEAGKIVPVRVSSEALDDHGLGVVHSVAEEKYDKGEVEPDGSVSVKTSDC